VPTLLLIRHAKAEPFQQDDLARVLAPQGRDDAARLQAWLLGRDLAPDRVVLSPSARTRETWRIASPSPCDVVEDRRVYEGELRGVIAETPADVHVLALVGHNPTLEQLLGELVPGTSGMSPCDAAVIEAADWKLTDAKLADRFTARS
jgi:phosphohistidine phosphatase